MNRRIVGVALVAALMSTSCGDDGESSSPPESLVLVAYSAFARPEALDRFTAATGIDVEILDAGDTGTMVSKAVLTAGKPEGDVMWGVDDASVARVLDAEVFVAHVAADIDSLDPRLTTYSPLLTPVDTSDVCLNYDKAWFRDAELAPPADFDDLTDPAYADLLVVENPATSAPGAAFLFATIAHAGAEGYLGYWEALRENGVRVDDDWDTAYFGSFSAGGGDGNRPLVVSYASSPPATVVFAEDPKPTEPTTGVVTATCYQGTEYGGVLRGTDHETEAGQLLDFLVSAEFQSELPLTNFVYPARTDVDLPPLFAQFAPRPVDAARLDPAEVATNREQWIDEWTTAVLR